MGICCSKANPNFSSPAPKLDPPIGNIPNPNPQSNKTLDKKTLIKEEPIINHRKSNETHHLLVEKLTKQDKKTISLDSNLVSEKSNENTNMVNTVRTSSCTREEIDAILIQCGRLSRSSSAVQTPSRKNKRSFDFDQETENAEVATSRESRGQSRPSPNRRRTPSREREREKEKNQLSQRRVSRSPVRRSESPMATTCHNPSGRPGKMVSVPATDKSCNGEGPTAEAVKKVAAKRNTAASPRRSRSPGNRANARVGNDNQSQNQNQQQGSLLTLSRSNSRKAGESPYRRNPLGEIDQNSQKQGFENAKNSKTKTKELPQTDGSPQITNNITTNIVAPSKPEPNNLQAVTRTRSSRLSRDLDNLNLEPQNPPPSSYTSLLLKDIQNFHNKNPMNSSNGTEAPTKENHMKKMSEDKEPPLVETEVVAMNDLMEPSFQKYMTVNVEKEEKEESSGSNSFAGGAQHWVSSSLWETSSNGSTDCWASSSRSNTQEDGMRKRDVDCAKKGIGKGRLIQSRSMATAATV